jgi:hypothetical protein
MLPLFCIIATPGIGAADRATYWTGWHVLHQVTRLAFAVPPMIGAALLFKYRRRTSLHFAVAVLWLVSFAWRLLGLVPSVVPVSPAAATAWHFAGGIPEHLGFDMTMAFAWTAYLLNAPRIQALYPVSGNVREIPVAP